MEFSSIPSHDSVAGTCHFRLLAAEPGVCQVETSLLIWISSLLNYPHVLLKTRGLSLKLAGSCWFCWHWAFVSHWGRLCWPVPRCKVLHQSHYCCCCCHHPSPHLHHPSPHLHHPPPHLHHPVRPYHDDDQHIAVVPLGQRGSTGSVGSTRTNTSMFTSTKMFVL